MPAPQSDGEHRLLGHVHQTQADHRHHAEVASAIDEAPNVDLPVGWIPGDVHALRGIPLMGLKGGLGGAILGTKPG